MPVGPYATFQECVSAIMAQAKHTHKGWSSDQLRKYAGGTCYKMEQATSKKTKTSSPNTFQNAEMTDAIKKHNKSIKTGVNEDDPDNDDLKKGTPSGIERNGTEIETGSTTLILDPDRKEKDDNDQLDNNVGDDDRYLNTDIDGDSTTTVVGPGMTLGIKRHNWTVK